LGTSKQRENTSKPFIFGIKLQLFDLGLAVVTKPAGVEYAACLFELNDLFNDFS